MSTWVGSHGVVYSWMCSNSDFLNIQSEGTSLARDTHLTKVGTGTAISGWDSHTHPLSNNQGYFCILRNCTDNHSDDNHDIHDIDIMLSWLSCICFNSDSLNIQF